MRWTAPHTANRILKTATSPEGNPMGLTEVVVAPEPSKIPASSISHGEARCMTVSLALIQAHTLLQRLNMPNTQVPIMPTGPGYENGGARKRQETDREGDKESPERKLSKRDPN